MIKIYTPKAWLSVFGGIPSIVINDNGFIYDASEYNNTVRYPIGKIDYSDNYVYGKDHYGVFSTPIATLQHHGDEIRVYEYGKSIFPSPILYIKNDKIYTPDEYYKIFGGEPVGYIKKGGGGGTGGTSGSKGGNTGGGEMPFPGLMMFLGFALLVGFIYLITNEDRVANASSVLALIVNVCAGIYFLWNLLCGKLVFRWDGKRFLKGLVTGFAVYFVATAILVIFGLFSTVGTGHTYSDENGDQMELAAMFIGLPCVVAGLLDENTHTATKKSGGSGKSATTNMGTGTFKTTGTSKTANSPAKTVNVDTPKGKQVFVTCPYCKMKFKVTVPPGVKSVQVTCQNKLCKKNSIINL